MKLTSLLTLSPPFGGAALAEPPAEATAYTLAGPAIGLTGVASTPFVVTPDGVWTGTITPADAGAGGSFSPPDLDWAAEAVPKAFAYTPAAPGTIVISTTNSGDLPDPDPVEYVAVAGGTSNHSRREWGPALEGAPFGTGGIGIF